MSMEAHDAAIAGVSDGYAPTLSPEEGRVISSTKIAAATGMPMKAVSAPAAPAKPKPTAAEKDAAKLEGLHAESNGGGLMETSGEGWMRDAGYQEGSPNTNAAPDVQNAAQHAQQHRHHEHNVDSFSGT